MGLHHRITTKLRFLSSLVIVALTLSISVVYAADNGVPNILPFQGRVTDSSGNPINIPVNVKFRVYPPTGSCYVYEETQSVTPSLYGIFSVVLGTAGNSTGPANNFSRVFNNDAAGTVTDYCPLTSSAGSGYVPATSDWRRLEIVVSDPSGTVIPSSGAVTLAQQTIGSSAFAISSQMLSGKIASDFIQVNSAISLTQANVATLVSGGDATALHTHDAAYAKRDGTNSFSGNINTAQDIYANSANGQIGIGTGAAAAGVDLHIVKSAPQIRLEATSGGAGNLALDFYSGATQRGSLRAAEGSNGLKLYSGTQEAMSIDANRAVTFQGSVRSVGTLGLGQYTDAQEPALLTALAGLGATATGTVWSNSTSNVIKYWNGSGAQTVATNGITYAGDVVGTSGALTVARIRGVNVDFSSAPTTGEVLLYDGTSWIAAPSPAGGLTTMNGLTIPAQTFVVGTSGITPNISSVGSVHTYNFPLASTISVTAGLLSKADYDAFAAKQAALGYVPVNRAGDTMTGVFTLAGDPTANLGASTKQYVDSSVSSASANFVRRDGTVALTADWALGGFKLTNLGNPTLAGDAANKSYVDTGLALKQNSLGYTPLNKAGDAMTGALTLAADPTINLGAATKQYVDNLVNGASGDYVQRDGSTTLTANWNVGAWKLTNLGTPTAATDAVNKTYVDSNYLAKNGSVTLTGNWNAGGFDISNIGNMNLAAQKNLTFGGYTDAQEGTLTLALVAGDAGKMWYNTTDDVLKFWDGGASRVLGVAGSGVGTFNTLTANVQTLSVNTAAGTAPVWNSAGSNHELRIPMANTASVTAGLISKTEYDTFNNKQAALGYTALNKAGDTMTGVLTLAGDPTANLGAATKQYVDTGLATKQNSLGFTALNKAGDTMTGVLTLAGDPTAALGAATKQYVDNLSSTSGANYLRKDGSVTLSANWNVGAWKITNLGTPTVSTDAATKGYVDGLASTPAAIVSLGGLTVATQLYAIDTTTGTAPAWNSATNTHTLRIPMANTASVTAGLISKAEYDTFNNKQSSLGYTPLNKAGDTMTGVLTLAGDPTANLGASTKQYVDSVVSTSAANFVRRDGSVTLNANWNVGAWKITNLGTPTSAADAATKAYVDAFTPAAVTSLGGLTVAVQSLAVDTATGTAPAWNSSGSTHTIRIPLASAASVTAGLISKTDYDSFAAKQSAIGYTPLNKAGDTMTGVLTLAGDPTANLGAATKQYVDTGLATKQNSLGYTALNKAGDTMTGVLTLAGDPTAALGAATKQYVDNLSSTSGANYLRKDGSVTLSANWNVGAWKITNLGTPTSAADAATKAYVDAFTPAAVTSLGGLTVAVQSLAVDTATGTAPAWNSTGSTHTIRIPLASAASVTAGLISKTEYDTFNNKQSSLGYTPLNKAGDTMTGVLTLAGDPTANLGAATKQYVDTGLATKQNSLGYTALNKGGDTMTGVLTLAGDPTANLGAATKQYVDNLSSTSGANYLRKDGSVTLSANWNVGAWKITNLGTPTAAADAATKAYVDSIASTPAAITSLGGLTVAVQTFATDTLTGTAPAWSSAGSSHTIRIPLANTALVTAGLISKTEYDTFNNKQAALGYTPLNKAGDTMTGVLTLAGDPTANLGASTKQYVDSAVSTSAANFVRRDGSVTLNANWNVGAWKITNLGTPTAGTDAATKAYVDSNIPASITSLGGLTVAVQTFAVDTATGTAPAWNSTGSAHTIRIPLASAASVTAGLLSKTEYDSFAAKQSALGYTPLNKAGDTMTGVLTLAGDPTATLGAATKGYVDTGLALKQNSLGYTALNKGGDTMTGVLTLAGDPTAALGAATKQYVDNLNTSAGASYVRRDGSVTLTANWDLGAWKLTNLGAPTASTDAATKGYVDTFGAGKLSLSGGTMTGVLTLAGDPTANLGAATKQYVDATVTGASSIYVLRSGATTLTGNWDLGAWKLTNLGTPTAAGDAANKSYVDTFGAGKLSLSGGTMTGVLTLAGDPTANLGAATKQYVDNLSSTAGASYVRRDGTVTLTANWDIGAWKLTNLGTPTAAGDAATKSYVDTFGAGKLSLSGGTMTGALTLAADPTANLGAATKQYVDNFVRRDGTVTLTGNWNAGTATITSGSLNATTFFYTSDRRLKTDIETIDGMRLIQSLRGVSFKWRKDNSEDIGLIAQEVEAVAPQLVQTTDSGYKAVKYGNLVGPLIEATKTTYGMCVAADQKAERGLASVHKVEVQVQKLSGEMQQLRDENQQLRQELNEIKALLLKRAK